MVKKDKYFVCWWCHKRLPNKTMRVHNHYCPEKYRRVFEEKLNKNTLNDLETIRALGF